MARTVAAGTITPVTENERLAYLAGLIDGEGCINISRYPHGHHNIRLTITGTDTRLIDWLLENFEGRFSYALRKEYPDQKTMLQWTLSGESVAKIIQSTFRYLVIKREQANLILDYWERHEAFKISSSNGSDSFQLEAEALKSKMHVLNRRGRNG